LSFGTWKKTGAGLLMQAREFIFLYTGGSTCGVLRVMMMGNEIAQWFSEELPSLHHQIQPKRRVEGVDGALLFSFFSFFFLVYFFLNF
jgi:hypothetical protein